MKGKIVVNNLGKRYKRYASPGHRLVEWLTVGRKVMHEDVWVLRGVTFEVERGESVGIVGQNGAGKSTLLKIIAGTTQATEGEVRVDGRVAALLELGMGFHPEFTGRQNAILVGQLMGLDAEAIARLMPDIEAFAEVGSYMDQQLRTYSSGMAMRLAFSVATVLRPDVLIVDEALAVGDAAFQRKCLRRIEEYVSDGMTLLFVSHDLELVKRVCSRAIYLRDGHLADIGSAKEVCDKYEKDLFGGKRTPGTNRTSDPIDVEVARFDPTLVPSCEMRYGNGRAEIIACWLEEMDGRRINVVESGVPFRWCYRIWFNDDVSKPVFAMMIKTREGISVYGVDSEALGTEVRGFRSGELIDVRFSLNNVLAPGVYYLNCGVKVYTENGFEFLSRRVDSAILRVTRGHRSTVADGLVEMGASLNFSRVSHAGGDSM